jgi:hypothetical protein
MKKLALLLALLMIVGCFAACGGDSEKNQETNPAAATGGAANQPTATNNAGVADPELCPDSADGKHQYTEEVAGEPSCTLPGLMMYTCSACQFSTTKEIPALGHQGTGASCIEPSICTVCGEIAEEAWGHDLESGICKNCGDEVTENGEEKPTEEVEEEVDVEATEEATVA